MFIGLIGTQFSGKYTVEDYLVNRKGFTPVRLVGMSDLDGHNVEGHEPDASDESSTINIDITPQPGTPAESVLARNLSFLSMGSSTGSIGDLPSPLPDDDGPSTRLLHHTINFSSPSRLLNHVTHHWRSNFVTIDLNTKDLICQFVKRPFFMLVSVDAPLFMQFQRSESPSLETFIREHDHVSFGLDQRGSSSRSESLQSLNELADVHIINSFDATPALYSHLDALDLTNPERLRPHWDTYFMTLASLASRRSNCMKRRVGAILVRNNRILSTGYNGTPRGLLNCNEGGCSHCNKTSPADECLCLHAEENALLEAGKERIGDGAVLYCNTCPCLRCTVKIIQTGVKGVVYNLSYKMDDDSAKLFKQAGVELRRHALP